MPRIKLEDGKTLVLEDGATQADIEEAVEDYYASNSGGNALVKNPADWNSPKTDLNTWRKEAAQGVGNTVAGAAQGVTDVGNLALMPVDYGQDYAYGDREGKESRHDERTRKQDEFWQDRGAETDSMAFKGANLLGNVAAGGGLSSIAGKGMIKGGAALANRGYTGTGNAIERIGNATQTGGFSLGNKPYGDEMIDLAGRAGARGIGGAINSAFVDAAGGDPSTKSLGVNAGIGAAIPLAGVPAAAMAKYGYNGMTASGARQTAGANAIKAMKMGDTEIDPAQIAAQLRTAKQLPDERASAGMLLDNAGLSGAERTMRTTNYGEFAAGDAASEQARLAELLRHSGTKEEREALKAQVRAQVEPMYAAVPDVKYDPTKVEFLDRILPTTKTDARSRNTMDKGRKANPNAYDKPHDEASPILGADGKPIRTKTEGKITADEIKNLKEAMTQKKNTLGSGIQEAPDRHNMARYEGFSDDLYALSPELRAADDAFKEGMKPVNNKELAFALAEKLKSNKGFANDASGNSSTLPQGEYGGKFINSVRNAEDEYPKLAGFSGFKPDDVNPDLQESIKGVLGSLERKDRVKVGTSGSETSAHSMRVNELNEAGIPDAAKGVGAVKKAINMFSNSERNRKALARALAKPLDDKDGLATILEKAAKSGKPLSEKQKSALRYLQAVPAETLSDAVGE